MQMHLLMLFLLIHAGTEDRTTWNGVYYVPLLDSIWKRIAIHSHHQQRCENYVQMAALVSKTKIGETRRTWRAIAVSSIIRRFNQDAVDSLRRAECDEEKRAKIKRVSGAMRIKMFSNFINAFMKEVSRARTRISDDELQRMERSIASQKTKRSIEEQKILEDEFEVSVLEALKTYAAETESGYEETAYMGGRVFLRIITKSNGLEGALDAELLARKISEMLPEFGEQFGTDASLDEIPITQKKGFLKLHAARELMRHNSSLNEEDAKKQINSVEPQSSEMRGVLMRQQEILNKYT